MSGGEVPPREDQLERPVATGRSAGASVDALRPEFESVDAFFQALLGVRAQCAAFDAELDALAELPEGSSSAWASRGHVPAPSGDQPEDETCEEPSDSRAAVDVKDVIDGGDGLAVLLGLVALRREVELGFSRLTGDGRPTVDAGDARAADGNGRRSESSGSLLR